MGSQTVLLAYLYIKFKCQCTIGNFFLLNEKAESIKTGGPLYNVSNNAAYWQMLCMWLMLYYLILPIFYFNFLLRTRTSFCTHTSV